MKYIILILVFFLLISCGVNRVYTPANYGATKRFIAKPIYDSINVKANYISLSFSDGEHPYNEDEQSDTKFFGSLNVHQSKTFKSFSYYYGIGFNYGVYNFKNSLEGILNGDETETFYTINPKIGFSIKESYSRLEYHIIGLELNYNYENGNYQDKLLEIPRSSAVKVVNEKSLFSYNLFTDLIFKINPENNIGLGFFIGGIMGLNKTKYDIEEANRAGFGGLIFSYRFKKITASIISESGARNIESINYGLTYQF